MKIKTQLTLATLIAMGLFATGCSQQTAQSSQAEGSSPAGQSAQSAQSAEQSAQSAQQAVEPTTTVEPEVKVVEKVVEKVRTVVDCSKCNTRPVVRPRPVPRPRPTPRPRGNNHTHPAIPGCTDSISHNHPHANGANHRHSYSCKKAYRRPVVQPRPPVRVVRPVVVKPPVVVVPPVKAKGNFKGPVMMSPETRQMMMQYQQ